MAFHLKRERLGYGDFWDRPARREMQRFLNSNLPMPDAIVCANDAMAIVACDMLHDAEIPCAGRCYCDRI